MTLCRYDDSLMFVIVCDMMNKFLTISRDIFNLANLQFGNFSIFCKSVEYLPSSAQVMFVFTILFTIFIGFWILLIILYIRDVCCQKSSYAAAKAIPGKRLYPILGNAPAIITLDRGKWVVLNEKFEV
jgi:hypothetical protein